MKEQNALSVHLNTFFFLSIPLCIHFRLLHCVNYYSSGKYGCAIIWLLFVAILLTFTVFLSSLCIREDHRQCVVSLQNSFINLCTISCCFFVLFTICDGNDLKHLMLLLAFERVGDRDKDREKAKEKLLKLLCLSRTNAMQFIVCLSSEVSSNARAHNKIAA